MHAFEESVADERAALCEQAAKERRRRGADRFHDLAAVLASTFQTTLKTPVGELVARMKDARYTHAVIDADVDACEAEWHAYRVALHRHPAVHRRWFIACEPDPEVQSDFSRTVFAHVTLENLTCNPLWDMLQDRSAPPPVLSAIAGALRQRARQAIRTAQGAPAPNLPLTHNEEQEDVDPGGVARRLVHRSFDALRCVEAKIETNFQRARAAYDAQRQEMSDGIVAFQQLDQVLADCTVAIQQQTAASIPWDAQSMVRAAILRLLQRIQEGSHSGALQPQLDAWKTTLERERRAPDAQLPQGLVEALRVYYVRQFEREALGQLHKGLYQTLATLRMPAFVAIQAVQRQVPIVEKDVNNVLQRIAALPPAPNTYPPPVLAARVAEAEADALEFCLTAVSVQLSAPSRTVMGEHLLKVRTDAETSPFLPMPHCQRHLAFEVQVLRNLELATRRVLQNDTVGVYLTQYRTDLVQPMVDKFKLWQRAAPLPTVPAPLPLVPLPAGEEWSITYAMWRDAWNQLFRPTLERTGNTTAVYAMHRQALRQAQPTSDAAAPVSIRLVFQACLARMALELMASL